jgi:penicillin-binding protein 1C
MKPHWRQGRWILIAILGLLLGLRLLAPETWLPQAVSTVVLDREGTLMGAYPARDGQWRFPAPDSLPRKLETALLATEDHRFYWHFGIDPVSVWRALRQNLSKGRVVSGGSTLTQQLARQCVNERLGPSKRSWLRKAMEAVVAISLEVRLSKREILILYATHAPFGANVRGMETASWRWFSKPFGQLSWGQAAALAVLPNSPSRVHPGRSREVLAAKRARLLHRLQVSGAISAEGLALALSEPLPDAPRALPQVAPHLSQFLRTHGEGCWKTTLDGKLQDDVTRLAREGLKELEQQEVHGLAAVVIQTSDTGEPVVRAWLGNAQGEDKPGGQVDAVLAPRSPGSALKPFLYGMLLDRGDLLPNEWLLDIPTRLGDLRPENADGICHGVVPASEALWRSLNIPWVRALRDLGADPFLQWLRKAGLSHLFRPADDYGMALAVGGCETSLLELAGLYVALGNGGVASPVLLGSTDGRALRMAGPAAAWTPHRDLRSSHASFLQGNPPYKRQILSKGASWLVLDALSHAGRSDEEAWWRAFAHSRPLAWKTGTSFGNRDAWAIGVAPGWVVAVWAGNPSGEGRTGLWGVRSAVPLMFRIFSLLPQKQEWFAMPGDLVPVPVCLQTGARATASCSTGTVQTPANGRNAKPDHWHQMLHLDSAGFQVDGDCEPPSRQIHREALVLPAVVDELWRRDHPDAPRLPPRRSDCFVAQGSGSLEILYPENGALVRLAKGMTGQQKLVLEARHRSRTSAVRCFLDRTDLGVSDRFLTWSVSPDPGEHEFLCTDEEGNQARSRFTVDALRP